MSDSYSHEGPRCPYCDYQITADEPFYYDEYSYNEDTCESCGKTFTVSVEASVMWSCYTKDEDD